MPRSLSDPECSEWCRSRNIDPDDLKFVSEPPAYNIWFEPPAIDRSLEFYEALFSAYQMSGPLRAAEIQLGRVQCSIRIFSCYIAIIAAFFCVRCQGCVLPASNPAIQRRHHSAWSFITLAGLSFERTGKSGKNGRPVGVPVTW